MTKPVTPTIWASGEPGPIRYMVLYRETPQQPWWTKALTVMRLRRPPPTMIGFVDLGQEQADGE